MRRSKNKIRQSFGSNLFDVINICILVFLGITTIYPFWGTLVISVSSLKSYLISRFHLWPIEFSFESYLYMFRYSELWISYRNTIFITIVGTFINMLITMLAAYVLSKKELKGQLVIMFLFVFTMLFSGGIIPTYIIVRNLKLMNTLWALIIPSAINTYNLIILRNFFSAMPRDIEESAIIDGCNEIGVLFRIVMPVSKPAITTIALFYAVEHWNGFFSAILYLTRRSLHPLQLFLRSMLFQTDAIFSGGESLYLMGEPMKMATIVLAVLPIMCFYPFFQKYFTQGVMLGAIKG